MQTRIKLPLNISDEQREIYNKNCELLELAILNKSRYGVLLSLCANLGSQDYLDEDKFIKVYPYSNFWYKLAYGTNFNNEPDFIIK